MVTVKNYVLDTNVLLHDARAIYSFADNNVIIPIFVLEELDTFKKDQNELGRNARQIARELDTFRNNGNLASPQKMPNNGTVRVALGTPGLVGAACLRREPLTNPWRRTAWSATAGS